MVEVCVDIPKELYEKLRKFIDEGILVGSIEEIIIDAIKDYVDEVEATEESIGVIE